MLTSTTSSPSSTMRQNSASLSLVLSCITEGWCEGASGGRGKQGASPQCQGTPNLAKAPHRQAQRNIAKPRSRQAHERCHEPCTQAPYRWLPPATAATPRFPSCVHAACQPDTPTPCRLLPASPCQRPAQTTAPQRWRQCPQTPLSCSRRHPGTQTPQTLRAEKESGTGIGAAGSWYTPLPGKPPPAVSPPSYHPPTRTPTRTPTLRAALGADPVACRALGQRRCQAEHVPPLGAAVALHRGRHKPEHRRWAAASTTRFACSAASACMQEPGCAARARGRNLRFHPAQPTCTILSVECPPPHLSHDSGGRRGPAEPGVAGEPTAAPPLLAALLCRAGGGGGGRGGWKAGRVAGGQQGTARHRTAPTSTTASLSLQP